MSILLIKVEIRSQTLKRMMKVLKEERHEKILELLDKNGAMTTKELAAILFVSLPTLRRDLAELHSEKLIIRSHGGAKKPAANRQVAPLNFRRTVNSSEKRKLCREGAKLISENNIIFIDASTTTLQLADFISPALSVTVVTNSIQLAFLLKHKGIKTYCTGGELSGDSFAYLGAFTEKFISGFNFDITFFSSYGINEKGMLTDPSLEETGMRLSAIRNSKTTVLLCDKTKLFLSAPYNLMPVSETDIIITDDADFPDFGIPPERIIKV